MYQIMSLQLKSNKVTMKYAVKVNKLMIFKSIGLYLGVVQFDQERFQIEDNNFFQRDCLNKWLLYLKNKNRKPETMKTYLNSVSHFCNYVKIVKNEVSMQFPLSNLQEIKATIKM